MTPQARQRRRVRAPVLAVCAGAWVVLLVLLLADGGGPRAPGIGTLGVVGPGLGTPGLGTASLSPPPHHGVLAGHVGPGTSPAATLLGWAAMLVAMMGPLLIPALRHVAERSLPRRRGRSLTLMLTAYLGVWSVGLLVLVAASSLIGRFGPERVPVAVLGLAVALAWQASPAKQRCLNRCHARPPMAAFGRAADLGALGFGRRQAQWCLGSCWALMLVPLLLPSHHLSAMLLVALWLWAERWDAPVAPAWQLRVPVGPVRIALAPGRPTARTASAG